MGTAGTARCTVSFSLHHESKFLGVRLRSPVAGEAARLSVALQNTGNVDVPAGTWGVIVQWSDGTELTFHRNLNPILRVDSADKSKTVAHLGPLDFPIQTTGVSTIFLDPAGDWPSDRGFRFEDAKGHELPYHPSVRRIWTGAFRATSWQLLYQKLAILIGLLTLASVILTRIVFP